MMTTMTAISGFVLLAGGLLLAAALAAIAGLIFLISGEWAWKKAKNRYRLKRLMWGLRDLEAHGQVFPRPDLEDTP